MSGVHVEDDGQDASLSSLNPLAPENCSASLRYRLRASNYQAIEGGYAIQPDRPDLRPVLSHHERQAQPGRRHHRSFWVEEHQPERTVGLAVGTRIRAYPLLIARAYGRTGTIAFSIPGRPG